MRMRPNLPRRLHNHPIPLLRLPLRLPSHSLCLLRLTPLLLLLLLFLHLLPARSSPTIALHIVHLHRPSASRIPGTHASSYAVRARSVSHILPPQLPALLRALRRQAARDAHAHVVLLASGDAPLDMGVAERLFLHVVFRGAVAVAGLPFAVHNATPSARHVLPLAVMLRDAHLIMPQTAADAWDAGVLPLRLSAADMRIVHTAVVPRGEGEGVVVDVRVVEGVGGAIGNGGRLLPFVHTLTAASIAKDLYAAREIGAAVLEHPVLSGVRGQVRCVKTVLFAFPWIRMGGTEVALLRLMRYYKRLGFRVAVVLVQPYFALAPSPYASHSVLGERLLLTMRNEWFAELLSITNDITHLSSLAPFQSGIQLFTYVLKTRLPSIMVFSNARWIYDQLPYIRRRMPQLTIVDYNHQVYFSWKGGGCPRYGANRTEYIDFHFAASNNVTRWMRTWMKQRGFGTNSDQRKAQTCYIGADLDHVVKKSDRSTVRTRERHRFNFAMSDIVVLFAGRFVKEKGIDVLIASARQLLAATTQHTIKFLIVGTGEEQSQLDRLSLQYPHHVIIHPPATSAQLQRFYVMADILVLPSVMEGVALVLYEAMAARLLVITTDVGGQRELVTKERGVLLQPGSMESRVVGVTEAIEAYIRDPKTFETRRNRAQSDVERLYSADKFRKCVVEPTIRRLRKPVFEGDADLNATEADRGIVEGVKKALLEERLHDLWAMKNVPYPIEQILTAVYVGAVIEEAERRRDVVRGIRAMYGNVQMVVPGKWKPDLTAEQNARVFYRADVPDVPTSCEGTDSSVCGCMWQLWMDQLARDNAPTEIFAFVNENNIADEERNEDEVKGLEEIVQRMRSEQWDVLSLRNDSQTFEQILWHDARSMRTCNLGPNISTMNDLKTNTGSSILRANLPGNLWLVSHRALSLMKTSDSRRENLLLHWWRAGLKVGVVIEPETIVRGVHGVSEIVGDCKEDLTNGLRRIGGEIECSRSMKAKIYVVPKA